ncbi:MAG: hypothetical protein KC731_25695, partial [Myxococcales bacterium]|nr:hypothetical protein [Myxococcales bacterium]
MSMTLSSYLVVLLAQHLASVLVDGRGIDRERAIAREGQQHPQGERARGERLEVALSDLTKESLAVHTVGVRDCGRVSETKGLQDEAPEAVSEQPPQLLVEGRWPLGRTTSQLQPEVVERAASEEHWQLVEEGGGRHFVDAIDGEVERSPAGCPGVELWSGIGAWRWGPRPADGTSGERAQMGFEGGGLAEPGLAEDDGAWALEDFVESQGVA